MPTKRNNEVKEFAIGTKIEYNGKLYEVVELFCDNCSIANICTNAEFTNIKKSDNLLSREQRYSIFGECSNYNRADGVSVVFKEVPKDDSKYEIDVESSDLSKGIIRFKRKGYVIPYNFPLNTRRGFRTIYYLMRLSQHDMVTVIKDIIAVRHAGINFILNICDKLEKENNCVLTSLRGG